MAALCKLETAVSRNPVPLIPMPQAMGRDAEIDQLKRELEILHARYAQYGRMGRVWKILFAITTPPLAASVLALVIKLILMDTLSGVFFLGVLLIFAQSGLMHCNKVG